jgi:hypothetical protein
MCLECFCWRAVRIPINGLDVNVSCIGWYLAGAFIFALIIRLFLSALNAWEYSHLFGKTFWWAWKTYFKGVHQTDDPAGLIRSDFWLPTFIGFLELITFPILLQTGSWTVIGAWIGFKTVAQWNVWTRSRSQFNRYLIGTALVVMMSIPPAVLLVTVTKPPAGAFPTLP